MLFSSYSSLCIYCRGWPERFRQVQRVVVVLSCSVVLLALGSIYTFGNMAPYIASYIRLNSKPSNLRYTVATYLYVVQFGISGISAAAGGYLAKYLGPRMVTLIGCVFITGGTALSYFAIQHSFAMLLVTYGVMFGIGNGLAYTVLVGCAMKWWPKWSGIASSVALSGYGLSAFLFNAVQTWFINPENSKPMNIPYIDHPNEKYFGQEEVLEKVPLVFLLLALCYAGLQGIGTVFISYPHMVDSEEDQDSENKESSKAETGNSSDSLQPQQMIQKFNFYMLFLMFTVVGVVTTFFFSLYKTFALEEVTSNDHLITIAASIGSVAGVIGRIFWGIISDLTDYKFSMVINSCLMTVLLYTFYSTSAAGEWMLFMWISATSFGIGGYYVLFPLALSKGFGQDYLSANYGVLYIPHTIGVIIIGLISDYVILLIGWYATLLLIASLSLVQFLLTVSYNNKKYSKKKYVSNFALNLQTQTCVDQTFCQF